MVNWFVTGNWSWRMKAELTFKQTLRCIDRAEVVAKLLKIRDPREELDSARFYWESWSELSGDDDETIVRLQCTIIVKLSRMCERIAEQGLEQFSELMDAIFDDLVEVRPS